MTAPTARRAAGELLVACARANLDGGRLGDIPAQLAQSELDWPLVRTMADEHGVLPLVHKAIEKASPDQIPPDQRQALRQQIQSSAARNMLLMQQLLRLIKAMHSQGIRVLPYKGPTLAMLAYGDLSLRRPGDLDIVVPRADLEPARKLLESNGLRMSHAMTDKELAAYLDSPHEYDIVYERETDHLCVELHWRLAGHFFSFNPDPVGLWDRSVEARIAGASVRVFSPEDMLLILCAHGMKHFWTRLTWICDLAQYIKSTPTIDWDLLLRRASELQSRKMTLLGLMLAHEVLGTEIPERVLAEGRKSVQRQVDELRDRLFLETKNPEHERPGADWQLTDGGLMQSLVFHVKTREDWTSGFRYFFHRAFTPNIVDHSWVHLPRGLSFLYYFVRPIRLFAKYGPLRFISRQRA